MAEEYMIHTPYDTDDLSTEVLQHFHLPSLSADVSWSPYAPNTSSSHVMASTSSLQSSPLSNEGYPRRGDNRRVFTGPGLLTECQGMTASQANGVSVTGPSTKTPERPKPNPWREARRYRRRIYELPYINPNTDHTITQVQKDAEDWVKKLIAAMCNTEDVKDPANSHHRRLFLSASIDDRLIDACCREIFTSLIDRCMNGFRGPPQFNKALKTSSQLDGDRTALCEERIQNVVQVLRWNKRVCKDVLYEDWKIRLLVNHPLSYDKEKDAQKDSNDQRRKRQLAEREKMEKTQGELKTEREKKERSEEELKALRQVSGGAIWENYDAAQFGDAPAHTNYVQPGWLSGKEAGYSASGTHLSKRPAFHGTMVNNPKRQRR